MSLRSHLVDCDCSDNAETASMSAVTAMAAEAARTSTSRLNPHEAKHSYWYHALPR